MANVGSAAPAFTLTGAVNNDDVEVSLSDYEGKNLVVLFYPLAFSPVCAEQVPDFNENLAAIKAKGAEVIAINRDSTFAHKAWSEALGGVDFPLLADMNLAVSKEFSMALEEVGITTRGRFYHRQERQDRFQARGRCTAEQYAECRRGAKRVG